MSYFYVQACCKGHYKITNVRLKADTLCDICGEPLMDKCPVCGEYIRKWTLYGATPMLPGRKDYRLPDNCPSCSAALPWAKERGVL